MYRIDTGQARTDLYQNNPLEFTELQKGVAESRKRSDEVKVAKDKAAQEHMDDIMENIGKANRVAYMPKDAQLIADKTQAVTDYVEKNIEALKKGDIQATMGYQKLSGDLYSFAEQSKNFREKWEAEGTGISKDKDAYRPESKAAYLNMASTKTAGQHDFDPTVFKKNVNYGDRVLGDLSQYAERAAQNTPYKKEFTLAQAETVIADDLKDAKRYEQAVYDFDNATDKLGAVDAIDYYKKVYAPKLVIGDIKPGPSAGRGGLGSKGFKPVTAVVTQLPDGGADATLRVDGKENIKLKTLDPTDPSGKATVDLTPMKVVKYPNGGIFLRGSVTRTEGGETPQEVMEVDYRDVANDMFTIFGIDNPVELLQGRGPDHVKFKNYDVSNAKPKAAAGTKAPAKPLTKKLKSGKTVYSDDGGKTYHP